MLILIFCPQYVFDISRKFFLLSSVALQIQLHLDDVLALVSLLSIQDELLGDCSKARAQLNWSPTCTFEQLVKMMVDSDMALLESGKDVV